MPARFAARLKRVLILVLLLTAGATAVWLDRVWLLQAAADAWIDPDVVGAADAVAVLGGGVEDRPFAAAEYFRRGLVKKVLVSNAHQGPAEKLNAILPSTDADIAVLLKLGVPREAIEVFGNDLHNTREEALALRGWARVSGARSVLVPTEIFATRRVRWMLNRVFPGSVEIRVPALTPAAYGRQDWWQSEYGLIDFQNELVKYLYYRLNY